MKRVKNNNIIDTELQHMMFLSGSLTFLNLSTFMLMNGISKYKFCKETSKKKYKNLLIPICRKN